jgi:hypothetical protein
MRADQMLFDNTYSKNNSVCSIFRIKLFFQNTYAYLPAPAKILLWQYLNMPLTHRRFLYKRLILCSQ